MAEVNSLHQHAGTRCMPLNNLLEINARKSLHFYIPIKRGETVKRNNKFIFFSLVLVFIFSACGGGTTLRYSITGSAKEATIVYIDPAGKESTEKSVSLPHELAFNTDNSFAFKVYVTNTFGQGDVKCEVFADDKSLGRSDGQNSAGCEGTYEKRGSNTQVHFTSTNADHPPIEENTVESATRTPAKEIDLGGAVISAIGNSENGAALYLFDTSSTQIVQWTEPLPFIGSADWSSASSEIILNAGSTGNVNSYVIELDGFSPIQTTKITTDNPGSDGYPDWSPNGEKVAVDAKAPEGHHIFVMNANGTARTQITSGEKVINSRADWSPDGSKIVFSSLVGYTDSTLIIVSADGTETTTLLEPQTDVGYINPVWSPNGEQIAFIFDVKGPEASIYVINADGTNLHSVTQTPAYSANSLAWSPDGTRLIFNATAEAGGVRGIYMINLDGSNLTYLTGLPSVSLESLRIVPQGYITALPTQPIQLFP